MRAIRAARHHEAGHVVFMTGDHGPPSLEANTILRFTGANTARIQEAHLLAGHLLLAEVERILCDG